MLIEAAAQGLIQQLDAGSLPEAPAKKCVAPPRAAATRNTPRRQLSTGL